MSNSLTTVYGEITRYTLYLVDTQEDRWDKGGTARPCDYIVFCIQKETKIIIQEQIYCTPQNSINS